MDMAILSSEVQMTSRELAELTGKEHKNVMKVLKKINFGGNK